MKYIAGGGENRGGFNVYININNSMSNKTKT
jgi:hypothetical protein